MSDLAVDMADILAAAGRVRRHIHRTPLLHSRLLDEIADATLLFKAEPLQVTGSFKIRGATNAVMALDAVAASRGVATHSSGNFAAALARAAAWRGIPAHVVMPTTSPSAKKAATEGYGGHVIPCEPTLEARESTLESVVAETGATFLHPYNHPDVIAGQGTLGVELIEDVPDLEAVLVPVGGGGLSSGVSIAVHARRPDIAIYGVEPSLGDDAKRSLATGVRQPSPNPRTIADGLKTALGSLTFPILQEHLTDILLCDDDEIRAAMALLWTRLKLVVEPSGATVLAALLKHRDLFAGKRVALVLSGGNLAVEAMLETVRA